MKRTRGKAIEDIIVADIEAIMLRDHVGKDKAITVAELNHIIGNQDETSTNYATRSYILKCMETCDLPIASCLHGYYIAETDEELAEYVHNLHLRSVAIYQRMLKFESSYWTHKALQAPTRPQEHADHKVHQESQANSATVKQDSKERGSTW